MENTGGEEGEGAAGELRGPDPPAQEGVSQDQSDPAADPSASQSATGSQEPAEAPVTSGVMENTGGEEGEGAAEEPGGPQPPAEEDQSDPTASQSPTGPQEPAVGPATDGQPEDGTAGDALQIAENVMDQWPPDQWPPEETDESEASEEELVVLDPEHPLVRRFQNALKNHLNKELERVNTELREKSSAEKMEATQLQDLTEELYHVQEKLARLQVSLEEQHQTTMREASEHRKAQDQLEAMKSHHHNVANQASSERTHVTQLQVEVDNLTQRLFYMQEVNKDLRSDIKAMTSATRKAQAEQTEAQIAKHKQELYVERLTKVMDRLTEQIALYEAQTLSQGKETQAAKEAFSEAQMEMEALAVERKQLLQHWDSSLIAMRKRDEAFTAMQEAIHTVKQQARLLDSEVEGLRKCITTEEEHNEELTMQLNRNQLDAANSKKLITESQAMLEVLQGTYSTYGHTLHETDNALIRLNKESNSQQSRVTSLRKHLEAESSMRLELEERIMMQIQDELTHDKAAKYSQRLTSKVVNRKKERIAQLWQLETELAAVVVENSEATQHLGGLASAMEVLEREIAERNKVISANQAKIAGQLAIMERKQTTINSYNMKIQQMATRLGSEDKSPLQIQVESLSEKLEELDEIMKKDRLAWMKQQQILVSQSHERQANVEFKFKLQTKYSLLQQTKIRTEGEIETEHREQGDLDSHMKTLRGDLVKLKCQLNKNGHLQQALEQDNTLMESDFLHRLKEAERDSVAMQMRLEKALEEKERLVNILVEAERQIMLWEKKIQLVRETRLAVDSDIVQGEMHAMKAEIHRMEVRYSHLLKQQERLLRESEATVARRESIVMQSQNQTRAGKNQNTASDVNRAVLGLRRSIQDLRKQGTDCDQMIKTLQDTKSSLSESLKQKQHNVTEMRRSRAGMMPELLGLQDTKELNQLRLVALQNRGKRLQAASEGRCSPAWTREVAEVALQRQTERAQAISTIVYRVSEELPQHQGALRRLRLLMASCPLVLEP